MELIEIKLHKNDTCLSFFVDEGLYPCKHPMHSLTITDGSIHKQEVFWDNILYFVEMTPDKVAECTIDLYEAEQYYEGVFKDIEYLIAKARIMGYLKIEKDE